MEKVLCLVQSQSYILQLSIVPSLVSADFCAHTPSSSVTFWPKHVDKNLPNLQQLVDKIIGEYRILDLLRGQILIYQLSMGGNHLLTSYRA